MKTISREKFRLRRVTVGAVMALMSTPLLSLPALAESLTCQVLIEARIVETARESKGQQLKDLLLKCPKAADTQGQPAFVQANIDLTLDANVANNRIFGAPLGNGGPLVVVGRSNITDAVLTVNENTADGPFATPNYLTGPGGAGQSPQYGLLTGSKTLTWNGVFLPVPGVAGNQDVTTIRITDIQVNLARPDIPVGAKLAMRPPGYRLTQNGIEWDASALATVPMPLPNPPPGFGLGAVNRPVSIALKINPVVSPDLKINLEVSPPTSGLGSAGTRLALQFTNIPSGASVWLPPVIYLFRQGSLYANNIQGFDVATAGIPNPSAQSAQTPVYQIPYGNQNPYGYPIYQNPYGYGGVLGGRPYSGPEDRDYNNPWGAPGPWGPGIPWEIPPMKK